jgi:hypothetical protein
LLNFPLQEQFGFPNLTLRRNFLQLRIAVLQLL